MPNATMQMPTMTLTKMAMPPGDWKIDAKNPEMEPPSDADGAGPRPVELLVQYARKAGLMSASTYCGSVYQPGSHAHDEAAPPVVLGVWWPCAPQLRCVAE